MAALMVGVAGFEPTTSCTQNKRTTRLCYTPLYWLGGQDSNLRPTDSKSAILPLNYLPKKLGAVFPAVTASGMHPNAAVCVSRCIMVPNEGLEPPRLTALVPKTSVSTISPIGQ